MNGKSAIEARPSQDRQLGCGSLRDAVGAYGLGTSEELLLWFGHLTAGSLSRQLEAIDTGVRVESVNHCVPFTGTCSTIQQRMRSIWHVLLEQICFGVAQHRFNW